MKTIYLVRHGKAEGRDTDKPDYERTLIERGMKDSLRVSKHLKKKKIQPALIISSPAPRALETAKIFARTFEYKIKHIRQRKAIYDQSERSLLDIVTVAEDDYDSIMLVGHNPSMDEFAQFLLPDFHDTIPTCGVVGIAFDTDRWGNVSAGAGRLELFVFPENVMLSKKSLKDDLEIKIIGQVESILAEIDPDAGKKMKKTIKKVTRELIKCFFKK
jgi:phosphohistidine phosphatase